MHIPFDAELPNLTYIVTQWGVCNLGTATPPIARERPFQRSPTLGYPVFMLTSFNAERQNSAWNMHMGSACKSPLHAMAIAIAQMRRTVCQR